MIDALLRDDRLRWDLAQLAANLDQLMPGGLGERVRFSGDEPLGLEGALEQMGASRRWTRSRRSSTGSRRPATSPTSTGATSRELLGDDAVRDLDALDELAAAAGAGGLSRARRRPAGAHAARHAGGSARRSSTICSPGCARTRSAATGCDRAGRGGEREETTKPYEFGDPFHLDLRGTLGERPAARGERAAAPARRAGRAPAGADDFEVFRTEQLTRTSTVLLVDMSRSMLLRGCFVAAKKVAIALDTLIRTQFPRDHLSVIGFAYYAREIRPEALAELSWHGYEYGTNLQHGLMLARRILAREHGGNKRDRRHHGRRADRALRGRPGRVQLPADPPHDPGDPARGRPLHARGHHDQHVHAGAVTRAGRIRRAGHAAQPGPRLLRHAGAPRRVRAGRLRQPADEARRLSAAAATARLALARVRRRSRFRHAAMRGCVRGPCLAFPWLLFLHILGAIVAFGSASRRRSSARWPPTEPQHGNFAAA